MILSSVIGGVVAIGGEDGECGGGSRATRRHEGLGEYGLSQSFDAERGQQSSHLIDARAVAVVFVRAHQRATHAGQTRQFRLSHASASALAGQDIADLHSRSVSNVVHRGRNLLAATLAARPSVGCFDLRGVFSVMEEALLCLVTLIELRAF